MAGFQENFTRETFDQPLNMASMYSVKSQEEKDVIVMYNIDHVIAEKGSIEWVN